jgi:superfamily II helicase
MCLELGITIQGFFIFGDIAETKETSYATLNYWKRCCKGQVGLSFIQPYPGSEIYRHCIKKGIIKDKLKFIESLSAQTFLNMTDKMSDKEFEKLKRDVLAAYIRHRKSAKIISIKKEKGRRYSLRVVCQFCKKTNEYKNFDLSSPLYFSEWIICRNCNMRIKISSFFKKLSERIFPALQPMMSRFVRLRHNLIKKKI